MRLTLFAAVLLVSLHSSFAAVPISILPSVDPMAKPPVNHPVHDKAKGTVGFISGLLLGPVGLGGVYLFSHNHAQRKAAQKGCVIFATVVIVAALCWLAVLGVKYSGSSGSGSAGRSGGSGSGTSGGSGRSGGSGSSSGPGSFGGGHHSNGSWINNINLPDIGSPSACPKRKPVPAQLPPDLPTRMFFMY